LQALGALVSDLARFIDDASTFVFGAIVVAVLVLLLLRFVANALRLNTFSGLAYYATRPANEMLRRMRRSHFYFPLTRAIGFDAAVLMVLVATAILCYIAAMLIGYLITVISGAASVLQAFGAGDLFQGGRFLIGTVLIAVVFYLLSLMTLVFVNWLFGLLSRPAYHAQARIEPLLAIFEFGGIFTGWSFLILWIALSLAARAIGFLFLP
jgi:hypothetical protein